MFQGEFLIAKICYYVTVSFTNGGCPFCFFFSDFCQMVNCACIDHRDVPDAADCVDAAADRCMAVRHSWETE